MGIRSPAFAPIDGEFQGLESLRMGERAFVQEFLKNESVEAACNAASVSVASGYLWLKRPDIQAAIRAEVRSTLVARAPAVAFRVLLEIAQDPTAPKSARVAAATGLADRSGFFARAVGPDMTDGKSLGELTFSELEARIKALSSQVTTLAKDEGAIEGEARIVDPADPFS